MKIPSQGSWSLRISDLGGCAVKEKWKARCKKKIIFMKIFFRLLNQKTINIERTFLLMEISVWKRKSLGNKLELEVRIFCRWISAVSADFERLEVIALALTSPRWSPTDIRTRTPGNLRSGACRIYPSPEGVSRAWDPDESSSSILGDNIKVNNVTYIIINFN